jgi:hypothetical protein
MSQKAHSGSGGIAPRIFNLGTRWRWVVSFTPPPLYPQGKSPWYPLDKRLGEPQSRSGHSGEEKNSQSLPGYEPSIIQPVAQRYTTGLSQFQTIQVRFLQTCQWWQYSNLVILLLNLHTHLITTTFRHKGWHLTYTASAVYTWLFMCPIWQRVAYT